MSDEPEQTEPVVYQASAHLDLSFTGNPPDEPETKEV